MAEDFNPQVTSILDSGQSFAPPPDFTAKANANSMAIYENAKKDPNKFWGDLASELHWFKKWDTVLDESNAPAFKWFSGGKLNVSYNCLDRHLTTPRKDKVAIKFEGEPGDARELTYAQLHVEVCKFANVLKSLGMKKGDLAGIYMPMIPEAAVAMLACARIGVAHNIVFGGFAAESLVERMNDAKAKVLITADGGWRRGKVVGLKSVADVALKTIPSIENVVVVKRCGEASGAQMTAGRDHWYEDLMAKASADCPAEQMDSEDPLFVLYTSGSTGKPKGLVHTTGGYLTHVYATTKYIFDIKDSDIYWCTADIGWVTGHSYIVYGPLANGATALLFEGTPDFPDKDRFWKVIEKYKVTIFYTAPTAIRTFMKWGVDFVKRCNLSSLRLLGSVGEPINPEAWMWYHENIGSGKCPVVDTWWQTETGGILVSPLPGLTKTKPGSACFPFPGIFVDILKDDGTPVGVDEQGYLVLTRPWPGMARTILNDAARYKAQYWSKYPGKYLAGDGCKRDKDGYLWMLGRIDDVLNVSGHRLSTMEIESALVDHKAVAEAAAIGKNHDVKGQAIAVFVTLKGGIEGTDELKKELAQHVGKKLGSFARPDDIFFTAELPKTRSGKIMRRLLRDIAEGRAVGDVTTLADASVIAKLKENYTES